MDSQTTLPADPRSAARARRFVTEVLTRWGLADEVETAELLVSELVTNALLYARSEVDLVVIREPGAVRVEVRDRSTAPAARREYSAESGTGRGLLLVEALARDWGVEPLPGGKAVWFRLDVAGEPGRDRGDAHQAGTGVA